MGPLVPLVAAEATGGQAAPVMDGAVTAAPRSLRELTRILRSPDRIAELEGALAELDTMIEAGDAEAALLLGTEYTKDRGTLPLDYAKAVVYLERAAALGMSEAYLTLADWHRRETGGLPQAKTITYLQLAVGAGVTEALMPLAYAYQRGTYGEADLAQAIRYFTMAADAGDATAAKQLVAVYRAGTGSPDDTQMLIKYLGISADAGDTGAMRALAAFYLDGEAVPQDLALAEQYLRTASDAGDSAAGVLLGRALFDGQIGAGREAEGISLLQAAFDGGAIDLAPRLADAYVRARGVDADLPKALGILQTASEAGDAAAKAALLNLYVRGSGRVLQPDLAAARALYETIPDEQRVGAVAANAALLASHGQSAAEFGSMWTLFAELDATLKARTGAAILRINKNAYVYMLQGVLAERGHYSGDLTGMLTSSTISAINRFCAELDIVEECRFGPLARTTWDAIAANGLTG